jgi:hypothetical protein
VTVASDIIWRLTLSLSPLLPRINVRYLIVTGFVLAAVGLIPLIYSNHGAVHGSDYWRHFFPGLVVGSLGMCFAYIGVKWVCSA